MNEIKPCKHNGFWVSIILLAVGFSISFVLNIGMMAGAMGGGRDSSVLDQGTDDAPEFQEEWSCGTGDTKVVRIAVDGVIMRSAGAGMFGKTTDMTEDALRQIRAAQNDKDVRAILLEVNSPGGAVTPSDEIYTALKAFRASGKDRRVVVFIRDLCASGGYYISMASDYIVSEPTAIVGSIGVIMESLNWSALSQKWGVDAVTIKSGANKDLLNPFRPVNLENVAILQAMINDAYERFARIVSAGRKMPRETLAPLADGRVFSAEDARAKGMVDAIGYWDDAVKATAEQLGVKGVKVFRYKDGRGFLDKLLSAHTPEHPMARVAAELPSTRPHMMYLWRP